jgi:hypothetical protein
MPERPYGEDDTSYGVFVDIFDGAGAWRLGASFLDSPSGLEGVEDAERVESVITPEVGLLAVDGIWEAGISAMIDYIETESDWSLCWRPSTTRAGCAADRQREAETNMANKGKIFMGTPRVVRLYARSAPETQDPSRNRPSA